MEVNKDKLIEVLKSIDSKLNILSTLGSKINTLDSKLNKIETYLSTNPPIKNNPPIKIHNSNPELIIFDRDGLTSLYNQELDEWSKKFIGGILSKDYKTVTIKQFSKLNEIANKVGYTGPIAK